MRIESATENFQKLGAKSCIIINHLTNVTVPNIRERAIRESAFFEKDGRMYFVLIFGHPGNKQIAVIEEEIPILFGNPEHAQCKKGCKRKNLCHQGAQCQM